MANQKAEVFTQYILDQLNAGAVEFEKVFELMLTKMNLARPTFAKYWKIAQGRYSEAQQAINKQKIDERTKDALNDNLEGILTRNERLKIASDIANGKGWKVGNNVMAPTASDRLKAIDYLSKIDGDYAPIKSDIALNKGFTFDIDGE